MEPSAIEKLLTGKRKRWFALVWGLVLTAIFVLPDVDRSLAQYNEREKLRVELATRAALPDRIRMLGGRLTAMQKEMSELEAALVPSTALSTFKQDITRMARLDHCRLRSIHPGTASRRPLNDILDGGQRAGKTLPKDPWEVEEQLSSVSIQGAFENLSKFLSTLDQDARVLQLTSLDLHPLPDNTDELVLDLQIKTFDLVRSRS